MSDTLCKDCGCQHGCLCGDDVPPVSTPRSLAAPAGSAKVVLSVSEYLKLLNALQRIADNDSIRHGYGYTGCGCSAIAHDALPNAEVSDGSEPPMTLKSKPA